MSEPSASAYTKADIDQLSDIHATHISQAFVCGDGVRGLVIAQMLAGLANAIAFLSGPDERRDAEVAAIVKYLPAAVDRCIAEIADIRGRPQ